MTESCYFEQFTGDDPQLSICEYCGKQIPDNACHWVRFIGNTYLRCIEQKWPDENAFVNFMKIQALLNV